MDLAQTVGMVGLWSLTLALTSWTAGVAVASTSRRTIWSHGVLFSLLLFGGTLGSTTTAAINPANAEVFSHTFYLVVFPTLVRTVVVLLPAAWGLRSGIRRITLDLPAAIAYAAIVTMLTSATARSIEGAFIFGWVSPSVATPVVGSLLRWRGTWQLNLLPLLMIWPAVSLVALASWRGWRGDTQVSRQ
jgi:hypothetical protein